MATTQPIASLESRCVGCQHRPYVCERIAAAEDDSWMKELKIDFEPENAYDGNAIKFTYEGDLLGYIPRDAQLAARQFVLKIQNAKGELDWKWEIKQIKWNDDPTVMQFNWFVFTVRVYGSER